MSLFVSDCALTRASLCKVYEDGLIDGEWGSLSRIQRVLSNTLVQSKSVIREEVRICSRSFNKFFFDVEIDIELIELVRGFFGVVDTIVVERLNKIKKKWIHDLVHPKEIIDVSLNDREIRDGFREDFDSSILNFSRLVDYAEKLEKKISFRYSWEQFNRILKKFKSIKLGKEVRTHYFDWISYSERQFQSIHFSSEIESRHLCLSDLAEFLGVQKKLKWLHFPIHPLDGIWEFNYAGLSSLKYLDISNCAYMTDKECRKMIPYLKRIETLFLPKFHSFSVLSEIDLWCPNLARIGFVSLPKSERMEFAIWLEEMGSRLKELFFSFDSFSHLKPRIPNFKMKKVGITHSKNIRLSDLFLLIEYYPCLKELYLLKTNLKEEAIKRLAAAYPSLKITTEIPD